jgi:exodeoxyribonuclease VII small subunit
MKKKSIEITYDTAYTQLRTLVAEIEDDSLQLDALADKVKQAKELIVYCENKLRGIEEKLG